MLDIIFLVLLIIGTYSGYKRGFILEVIGILAIFIGIYGALQLLKWTLGFMIRMFPGYSSIIPFLLFIVLFILIIILVNLLGKILKRFIDTTLLGPFDHIAGAISGFIMWSFMISLFIWLFQQAAIHIPDELIRKSYIYPYMVKIAPSIGGYFSSLFPFAQSLISEIKDLFIK